MTFHFSTAVRRFFFLLAAFLTPLVLLPLISHAAIDDIDSSFTANGESCEDIVWTWEILDQYPNIGDACQEVETRNGSTYVKFTGKIRSVNTSGSQARILFAGSDHSVNVDIPENTNVSIDGRSRRFRDLSAGDEITVYLPASRFALHLYEPDSEDFSEANILPETLAMLPDTASKNGWYIIAGVLLLIAGPIVSVVSRRLEARRRASC